MLRKTKVIICFILISLIVTNFVPLINVVNMSSVYADEGSTSQTKQLEFKTLEKTLALGKTLRYSPTKKGINSKATMTWTSTDPNVAIVDEKGCVTSLSRGTTTIQIACDGLSASYALTVVPATPSIYDNENNAEIKGTVVVSKDEEKSFYLQDKFLSISDSEVVWTSSKENICTVDENGQIKAIDNGTATITASLKDNEKIKSSVRISVATPVEEIEVEEENILTYVGEKAQIEYLVLPEYAANSRVKFEVEDKEIASVTTKGVVTGKQDGYTTVTISSISNPEITTKVNVEVREEREYKEVKLSEILSKYKTAKVASDASYKVDVDGTISILNDYGLTAKFTNNNRDIVKIENDENQITIKGLKDGVATIKVEYEGITDTIKVVSGNYIDKTVLEAPSEDEVSVSKNQIVQKIKAVEDPDDSTKTKDYVKDYPLEVGVVNDLVINVSPVSTSVDDLKIELSNTKDFSIENGGIIALNPNKSTDLIISSISNPKITTKIKLKSSIGNVKEIYFADNYVGSNKLDINEYKSYTFNPIFVMESGQTYDPYEDPEIVDTDVYKALKKNITITCEDEDVVEISGKNVVKLKKGVDGTGILKIEYDKMKNSRATEESEDITAETNFEAVGTVIEYIKKIKFVQSSYDVSPGEATCFNPIFTLSEGTVLDPTEEGVVESEEYQKRLAEVGLMNGTINNTYTEAAGLLNFTYKSDGNTNNVIDPVYEGTCKIKMVLHADNSICAETVVNIKSPYVIQNEEAGLKVSKTINATQYVNTDSLKIASDASGGSEVISIPRSTPIWTFEKYTNGYSRVAYNVNGALNENLYVESKYLADSQAKTVKQTTTTTSSSSSSSSSKKTSSSSSSSSSSKRGNLTSINGDRYVNCNDLNFRSSYSTSSNVISKLSKGTKIYAIDKDSNGWVKATYNGKEGYVKAEYLSESKPKTSSNNTTKVNVVGGDNTAIEPATKYYINCKVKVKTKLGIGGDKITLEKGTEVLLIQRGFPSNIYYCSISYNGKTYYTENRYVQATKP